MCISDLNFALRLMTPSSEASQEDRALKVSIAIELLEVCDFLEWPFYFRRLLLCSNCNRYKYRLQIVCFFVLNKYPLHLLCDFLYHLNPHCLNKRSRSKILHFIGFFYLPKNIDKYSSFDISKQCVTTFSGKVLKNVNHSNYGYISCISTDRHLAHYGLTDLLPFQDPSGYKHL